MRRLVWLRNNLRLHDNPALLAESDAEQLLVLYIWQEARPWCNQKGMGPQRERFLIESLEALRDALGGLGQNLLILQGAPELIIPQVVADYGIHQLATDQVPGYYERRTLEHLHQRLEIPITEYRGNTLFEEQALPFTLQEIPKHYTPFREKVESLTVPAPTAPPERLPPPPAIPFDALPAAPQSPHTALPVRGGSNAGQRRLHRYIHEEGSVANYKSTRDCLDGLDGTSTLSPWLANGSISAREVVWAIHRFEKKHGASESTEWLLRELLWREFFQWRALKDDVSLFKLRPDGGRKRLHNCTFEPRSFARWSQGDTDYPIVNALMRQLLATGWMSNRGRQLAASCLVNELGIDWRFGAALFEKHLIDYDVASNYGNWQYIAGVGADPRGGRHFDLQKQAARHDPDGEFTTKWEGYRPTQPQYVIDAADWPIG